MNCTRQSPTLSRQAIPLRLRLLLKASGLTFLLVATQIAFADTDFTGVYDEIPVKGFLLAGVRSLPITRQSESGWRVQLPPEIPESIIPRRWQRLSDQYVADLFGKNVPTEQVECIMAHHSAQPMRGAPVFCAVPINQEVTFRENGSYTPPHVSHTGFILVFGSPAGVHSVDFRKNQ